MKRIALGLFSIAVALLSLSCKAPESNYVKLKFKYMVGGLQAAVLQELDVVVLRGNVINANTAAAISTTAFAISGCDIEKFFIAKPGFNEATDYVVPVSMPDDSKIEKSIPAASIGSVPFASDATLYVYYKLSQQGGV